MEDGKIDVGCFCPPLHLSVVVVPPRVVRLIIHFWPSLHLIQCSNLSSNEDPNITDEKASLVSYQNKSKKISKAKESQKEGRLARYDTSILRSF